MSRRVADYMDQMKCVRNGAVPHLRRLGMLVVYGGVDEERAVSMAAVQAIQDAVNAHQIPAQYVSLKESREQRRQLTEFTGVLLNLANGVYAEGGSLVAIREAAKLPFVGSGAGASAMSLNKWATALVAETANVPIPLARLLSREHDGGDVWAGPSIVKPVDSGSSVGISLAGSWPQALDRAAGIYEAYGQAVMQPLLTGPEYSVPVLDIPPFGPLTLPVIEAKYPGEFASTYSKYTSADTRIDVPADIGHELTAVLELWAISMHQALGLRGYSRSDFRLADDGKPYLLEVNHTPGLAPRSWLPRSAASLGIEHQDLIVSLLASANFETFASADRDPVPDAGCDLGRRWLVTGSEPGTRRAVDELTAELSRAELTEVPLARLLSAVIRAQEPPSAVEATAGVEPEAPMYRALLDSIRARRTGPSIAGAALAANKLWQRTALQKAGARIPAGASGGNPARWPAQGPWVVKPVRGTQSRGVRKVASLEQVREIVAAQPDRWLVEEFIVGTEFVTSILLIDQKPTMLPTLKVGVPECELCDYPRKLLAAEIARPVRLGSSEANYLREITGMLLAVYGNPAISRIDWRLSADGPVIFEYDVFPAFGPNSYFAKALASAGMRITDIISELPRSGRKRL